MAKEMQFDGNGATFSPLKGVWINSALQVLDTSDGSWDAMGNAGDAITAKYLTTVSLVTGGIYYADAPGVLDAAELLLPYTILYFNAANPTWGSHIGVQYYDPMSSLFSTMVEVTP